MHAFVVGDHDRTARQVRLLLLQEGHECPAENLLLVDLAADRLSQAQPELVVVALGPTPDRALELIGQVRSAVARCPIVAVGPTADARLVIQTLRAGAGDFVEESHLADELPIALRRLQDLAGTQGEPAKTIAVLAPNGGSGSSTLAVNIAASLADKYKSVLLLDLKLQTGDLAALLDLKATHTLADLCQHADRMDRSIIERSVARHASGVDLLAPPQFYSDAVAVTPEGVRQALKLARTMYPFIVVDVDHSFAPEQVQVLRQADVILLVLRLDFASLRNVGRTLDYLKQLGIEKDRPGGGEPVRQSKEVLPGKAEEAWDQDAHYVPEDPRRSTGRTTTVPVVRKAVGQGVQEPEESGCERTAA